jgi:hypothetical protein
MVMMGCDWRRVPRLFGLVVDTGLDVVCISSLGLSCMLGRMFTCYESVVLWNDIGEVNNFFCLE